MRRLSVVALVVALVASLSAVALAQEGPKVSGTFRLDYEYPLSGNAEAQQSYLRARLGVSGTTSANVDYQVQVQYLNKAFGENKAPTLRLANATLKSAAVPGLKATLGRQFLAWSNLNWFDGLFVGGVDGVTVALPISPLKADVFYGQTGDGWTTLARATYTAQLSGSSVDLSAQLRGQAGGAQIGYGLGAKAGLGSLGSLYAEVGTNNTAGSEYQVVGVNVDALKAATGITAWLEYDLKGSQFAWSVGREMVPGLKLSVTNVPPSAGAPGSAALVAETSLSF